MTSLSFTSSKVNPWVHTLMQIVGGSLFIAFCSQVKIPLGLVPLSLQTLAVGLVGAMLGSKRGAAAVLLYLAECSTGLPFLAGGAVNPLALIGPTAGYLVGMVLQAYFVGWYYEHTRGRRFSRDFCFNAIAGLIVIVLGTLWLSNFVGTEKALAAGFFPFLIGDAIKSAIITRTMIARQRIRL